MKQTFLLIATLMITALASGAWTSSEILIGVKVSRNSNVNSYKALGAVEEEIKAGTTFFSSELDSRFREITEDFPPLEKPREDAILDYEITASNGVVSISSPQLTSKEGQSAPLSNEARRNMFLRIQTLIAVYAGADATADQKYFIHQYLQVYFGYDLNLSPESMMQRDFDMIEVEAIVRRLDERLSLKNGLPIDETTQAAQNISGEQIEKARSSVIASSALMMEKLKNTTEEITAAINSTNKESINFLARREKEREVRESILSIEDYDEIDKKINIATTCVPLNASDPLDTCVAMKEQIPFMQNQSDSLFNRDLHGTAVQSLGLVRDLALVFGEENLARDVGRALYTVDTAFKIQGMADKLAVQSGLAATGNVMAMASLAFSLSSVFADTESESSGILRELAAIRKSIAELRQEMHTRFNALALQATQLGIGVNLKLDNVNENIAVVIDNQERLEEFIRENTLGVAGLAQIQSDENIKRVLADLRQTASGVALLNDPSEIQRAFSAGTNRFYDYLIFAGSLDLKWNTKEKFDFSSDEFKRITEWAAGDSENANFSAFGLIDYIIQISSKNDLGGSCVKTNTNEIYLFNLLGSALLSSFREIYKNKPVRLPYSERNKYLAYLSGAIDGETAYKFLNEPLSRIDRIISNSQECLTKYAKVEEKVVNLVEFLLTTYRYKLKSKIDKILSNTMSGNHIRALNKAIRDSNQGYFSDSVDNFSNLVATRPELRGSIDIVGLDFSKTLDENSDRIDEAFFQKFKTVKNCQRAHQLRRGKNIPGEQERLPDIELPRNYLLSILPSTKTKLAMLWGFNSVEFCQSTGHYVGPEKFAEPSAAKVKIYMMATEMKAIDNVGRHVEIEFYIPTYNLTDHPLGNMTREELMASQAPIHAAIDQLRESPFDCTDFRSYLKVCWPEGYKPSDAIIAEGNTIETFPPRDEERLKVYSNWEKQMVADDIEKVYNQIRGEMTYCYRRSLLGFTDCQFGEYLSFENSDNRIDLEEVNQLNAAIRLLIPLITTFKQSTSPSERTKFITDFDSALKPPAEILLEINGAGGDVVANLQSELNRYDQTLTSLSEQGSKQLDIDIKSLLHSETYEGLKFYRSQTAEFFGIEEVPK